MAMEQSPAHIFARTYEQSAPVKRKAQSGASSSSLALAPYAKRGKDNDFVDVSNMAAGKEKQYRNFWVPALQKAIEHERVEKPVCALYA